MVASFALTRCGIDLLVSMEVVEVHFNEDASNHHQDDKRSKGNQRPIFVHHTM
jgi:hypothetical protein